MTHITFQLYRLVAVAILGSALALGFDVYRAVLRAARPSRWWVMLLDLMLVAVMGLLAFIGLFAAAYWSVRFYVPAGLGLGVAAYQGLAHPAVGALADALARRVIRLWRAAHGLVGRIARSPTSP